jgi:hypothetical protein
MIEKDSIRKFIFRDEINYIFNKYHIFESDEYKIVHSIFGNPLDSSKTLVLNDDINDFETLNNRIESVIKDKNIVGALGSLFLVQDDLELPTDIKKIILNNEKLGILVGAGVSKLIGLPLWNDLANKAIEFLRDKHLINYFECQKILNEIKDPKQKLTIFHEFISKDTIQAKQFYEDQLTNEDINTRNPYDILVKINSMKLTTNLDKEFYFSFDRSLKESNLTLSKNIESVTFPPKTSPV